MAKAKSMDLSMKRIFGFFNFFSFKTHALRSEPTVKIRAMGDSNPWPFYFRAIGNFLDCSFYFYSGNGREELYQIICILEGKICKNF